MDDQQLGALIRAVRLRRGLRQADVAAEAGVSQGLVSLVERGHLGKLSMDSIRRLAGAVEVRISVDARWRGGDAGRLLSRRHSLLADGLVRFVSEHQGWVTLPEASFSIYGERGSIDLLAWHALNAHLLVIELKTEFVDLNETLATLDRKVRLAPVIAKERGWRPELVSVWLIVTDTGTTRRHAREHGGLLASRFELDGRSFASFLGKPHRATTGLAFWSLSNRRGTRPTATGAGGRSGRDPSRSRG